MKALKWILLVLILALVALRIALPGIIKKEANAKLATLPEYEGHVDRVGLAIWRGAFSLGDLTIKSKKGDMSLAIDDFWIRIHWLPLIKKLVVADVRIDEPKLRLLVEKPSEAAEKAKEKAKEANKDVQAKTGKTLPELLRSIMPFRIDHFQIIDGTIRVREKGENVDQAAEKDKKKDDKKQDEKEPGLEARVTDVNVDVENLTNTKRETGTYMSRGEVSAKIMDEGKLLMHLRLNPMTKAPTFKMDLSIKKFDLRTINPILRWQTGMDVNRGKFELYAEAAAADGGFEGYIKPFIEDLDMVNLKHDKNPIKIVKEAVVGAAASVLSNQKEQVATKVPFAGKFDNPDVGIWQAISQVLRNAFIHALTPKLDQDVNMKDAKKEGDEAKKDDKKKDKKDDKKKDKK